MVATQKSIGPARLRRHAWWEDDGLVLPATRRTRSSARARREGGGEGEAVRLQFPRHASLREQCLKKNVARYSNFVTLGKYITASEANWCSLFFFLF